MRRLVQILKTHSGEPQNQEEELLLDSYVAQMKDYYKQRHLAANDRAAKRKEQREEVCKKSFVLQH